MENIKAQRAYGLMRGLEATIIAMASHLPKAVFLADVVQELDAARADLVAMSASPAALDELSTYESRLRVRLRLGE